MKVVVVIFDGLSDRPSPELNQRTPLMAANKPNLDRFATLGINGFMHPISAGIAPSTDLAHFVLWGYSLGEYPGRAVIEAWGEDKKVEEHHIVLRASLVPVEEKDDYLNIKGREITVNEEELKDIACSIDKQNIGGITIRYEHSEKRQGFLFLEGRASPLISDSDPFDTNLPVLAVQPLAESAGSEDAKNTSRALNRFLLKIYRKLNDHPVNHKRRKRGLLPINCLVTKWPGIPKSLDSFKQKYNLKGAIVANGALLKGLAISLGMDFYQIGEEGDYSLAMKKRCQKAIELLTEDYTFVHIHSKAADEAAHTKNPSTKKEVIEKLDASLSPFIKKEIYKESLLIVTSDHSTPSIGSLIHSGEPVPILAVGPGLGSDDVNTFDEQASRKGSIGPICGKDLMPLILNYSNRIRLLGTRSFSKDFLARPTKDRAIPLRPDATYGE